ncbi:hypothetical protein HMPREF9413_1587 [Paenibacillus sp. HGF7]|nr:hypothetical protein HMPREF9413_1587 [Paenibacillus sp. HGF7]
MAKSYPQSLVEIEIRTRCGFFFLPLFAGRAGGEGKYTLTGPFNGKVERQVQKQQRRTTGNGRTVVE